MQYGTRRTQESPEEAKLEREKECANILEFPGQNFKGS